MNLAEIIEQQYAELDQNPDLASYKKGMVRRTNRAMHELLALEDWLFLQSPPTTLRVYASVTGTSSTTVAITGGSTSYAVVFTGVTPSSTWTGHEFIGPDSKSYTITYVSGSTIYLYSKYEGDTVAASSSWTIDFSRYPLPVDCLRLQTIVDRNLARPQLLYVSQAFDARWNLRRAIGGLSTVAVDEAQRTDRAPDTAPTVANGGAGSLTVGSTYEYAYSFILAGRESPMSASASVTITAGLGEVAVSGMENTKDGPTALETGIRKRLYRRNRTINGRWLLISDEIPSSTTTATDTGATVSLREANEYFGSEPYRQSVRFWPTPSATRDLEIRYVRRVRDLVADSDTPPIPIFAHHYLVYRPLADVCLAHGMESASQFWQAKADTVFRKLVQTDVQRSNTTMRREPMVFGPSDFPFGLPAWWGPARWPT